MLLIPAFDCYKGSHAASICCHQTFCFHHLLLYSGNHFSLKQTRRTVSLFDPTIVYSDLAHASVPDFKPIATSCNSSNCACGRLILFFIVPVQQAKCCQVTELGDADSRFPLLENIRVHAKSCLGRDTQVSRQAAHKQEGNNSSDGRSTALLAVHCYHGFGANLYSWGLSQKLLVRGMGYHLVQWALKHGLTRFRSTHAPSECHREFQLATLIYADLNVSWNQSSG